MKKTFNFYCDESTHIENDGEPFMLLSYVSTPYNQLQMHNDYIRSLKQEHYFKGEIKWSNLSKSQYPFYNELIEYFFATDLQFRCIVIDKEKMRHKDFDQTHDQFYDKMYYQLLNKKILPEHNYNIYIDIKDTHSYKKAASLKKYLERDYYNIRNLQVIRSYESELLQMSDVIMGAINYKLRSLNKVTSKNKIIEKVEALSGKTLDRSTPAFETKFNLFFIDLK